MADADPLFAEVVQMMATTESEEDAKQWIAINLRRFSRENARWYLARILRGCKIKS